MIAVHDDMCRTSLLYMYKRAHACRRLHHYCITCQIGKIDGFNFGDVLNKPPIRQIKMITNFWVICEHLLSNTSSKVHLFSQLL